MRKENEGREESSSRHAWAEPRRGNGGGNNSGALGDPPHQGAFEPLGQQQQQHLDSLLPARPWPAGPLGDWGQERGGSGLEHKGALSAEHSVGAGRPPPHPSHTHRLVLVLQAPGSHIRHGCCGRPGLEALNALRGWRQTLRGSRGARAMTTEKTRRKKRGSLPLPGARRKKVGGPARAFLIGQKGQAHAR